MPPEQVEPVDLSVKTKDDQAAEPQPGPGHGKPVSRVAGAQAAHGPQPGPQGSSLRLPRFGPHPDPPRPPSGPLGFTPVRLPVEKARRPPGNDHRAANVLLTEQTPKASAERRPNEQQRPPGGAVSVTLGGPLVSSPRGEAESGSCDRLPRVTESNGHKHSDHSPFKYSEGASPPLAVRQVSRYTSSGSEAGPVSKPSATLSVTLSSTHSTSSSSVSVPHCLTVEPRTVPVTSSCGVSRTRSPTISPDHGGLSALDLPALHMGLPLHTSGFCMSPDQVVGTSSPLRSSDPAFLLHMSRFSGSLPLPLGLDLTLKSGKCCRPHCTGSSSGSCNSSNCNCCNSISRSKNSISSKSSSSISSGRRINSMSRNNSSINNNKSCCYSGRRLLLRNTQCCLSSPDRVRQESDGHPQHESGEFLPQRHHLALPLASEDTRSVVVSIVFVTCLRIFSA